MTVEPALAYIEYLSALDDSDPLITITICLDKGLVELTSQVYRNHGTNDDGQEKYLDRARYHFN